MKSRYTLLVILLSYSLVQGQSNIKGIVSDTTGVPLIASTVILMDLDSTMVDFTQTDINGYYQFKKITEGSYLIKATYVGYIPFTITAIADKKNVDIPDIQLTELASELMEVVIKAAKAPIKMRGDTIEYDASTFKVPEGSTIEDLLRRLPGIEVERDGSLKADGKDISKVTVEGKDFFGGDPKTITKNLPAEGVSKVQVYDKKTEEEKLTGIKSSTDEKEMNITLKEDFKKGSFGKVIAGGGNIERGEIKGNINRFNKSHQLSLVGVLNNTGRNGLGWDDYQDFMGASAFSFDNGGMYGFGSGGGFRTFTFGSSGQNNLENKISNAFFGGGGGGLPKRGNAGINYNYDQKKDKVGVTYFYNYDGNEKTSNNNTTTFLDEFTTTTDKSSIEEDKFGGHRAELSYERELDSLHTLVFKSDLAQINSTSGSISGSFSLKNQDSRINDTEINNGYDLIGSLVNSSALLRKSFKKKGRFLGFNMGGMKAQTDEKRTLNSTINFFNTFGSIDSTQTLNQLTNTNSDKTRLTSNIMYSEPLNKIFFWSTFFNFSKSNQSGLVDANDVGADGRLSTNDFLTRDYTNEVLYYRGGTVVTFSKDGFNAKAGIGYQNFNLKGTFNAGANSPFKGSVDQSFDAVLPFINISSQLSKTARIDLTYQKELSQPQIEDLLPIVDNSNPLYIREGNQNLLPEESHSFSMYASKSIPLSGLRIYLNANASLYQNRIIQQQEVDPNTFITKVKPVNNEGGNQLWGNIGISFPIVKNKLKTSINYSNNVSNSFTFVNAVLNETQNISYRPRISLDWTPNDNLSLFAYGNTGITTTTFSISTSQNQKINQSSVGADFNCKIVKDFYLVTTYNHNFYSNDRFGQQTDIPIINASVYYQFLPGKKGEIRLSIYDMLNENRGFNQFTGLNTVGFSANNSLARYGMLTFTYNIRGNKTGLEKNH